MESATVERNLENDVETGETHHHDDNNEIEENRQHRQDFTSESNKIEIGNLGKFVFGVS